MYRYFVAAFAVMGLFLVGSRAWSQDDPPGDAKNPESVKRPAFLGVQTGASEQKGALVEGVMPKSPAAKAGLKKGDIITRLDDQAINGPRDLVEAVRGAAVGKEVTITAQRGDKSMQVKAKLEAAPRDLLVGPPPGAFPGGPGGFRPPGPQLLDLPDRVRQLQERVDELERRVRALEKQKSTSGSK